MSKDDIKEKIAELTEKIAELRKKLDDGKMKKALMKIVLTLMTRTAMKTIAPWPNHNSAN